MPRANHGGTADINPKQDLGFMYGRDLADPYLSPLFADFSRGFPPSLIQAGTRDLFDYRFGVDLIWRY